MKYDKKNNLYYLAFKKCIWTHEKTGEQHNATITSHCYAGNLIMIKHDNDDKEYIVSIEDLKERIDE